MNAATSREPFDGRLVFGLVAAGVLAFFGFVLLTAYAGNFRSGHDGRPHALSVSAVGFSGLVDLIGYTGENTYLVRSVDETEGENLLIVPLVQGMDETSLVELLERRRGQLTLLILPKWMTQPHPLRQSWVSASEPMPAKMIQALLPKQLGVRVEQATARQGRLQGRGFLQELSMDAPQATQTVAGEEVDALLATPGGNAVLARIKNWGGLYVLADPDLLNNQGLKDKDAAKSALRLIAELNSTDADGVDFDLTLSGFGEKESVLKLAFEPPFLALTAALLIAALLAGLHGAARFGPAPEEARAIALGKAALVDNSAGLIRLARREHRVGGAYADLVRDAAAHVSGAAPNLTGKSLEDYLDRIGKPDGRRFTELAEDLRSAGDRDALLRAAHALFLWKKEISQ